MSKLGEGPRLRDYLEPDQLNTDGCVKLVSVILQEAAEDYMRTRRILNHDPTDRNALGHMANVKQFYRSKLFKALSAGLVDGEAAMRELDRHVM